MPSQIDSPSKALRHRVAYNVAPPREAFSSKGLDQVGHLDGLLHTDAPLAIFLNIWYLPVEKLLA
jgi:hypothetical protein